MLIFKTQCCTSRRTLGTEKKRVNIIIYRILWKAQTVFQCLIKQKKNACVRRKSLEYHIRKIASKYFSLLKMRATSLYPVVRLSFANYQRVGDPPGKLVEAFFCSAVSHI